MTETIPKPTANTMACVSEALGLALPGAAVGGPIGLLRDGDIIRIDAESGTLDVELSAQELSERRKLWKPRQGNYGSGALWRYANTVGDADKGAVTHPGALSERLAYVDI